MNDTQPTPESDNFVTIATFTTSLEARLALALLGDAGIPATIINERVVETMWMWSQLVGGVKIQVPEEYEHAAQQLLAKPPAEMAAINWDDIDCGDETADDEPDQPTLTSPNAREMLAERAWKSAVLGLLFVPLQPYAFCQLVDLFFRSEPLAARYQRFAWLAAAINLPVMVALLILMRWFLIYGFQLDWFMWLTETP
jgi:hypothetical protein